MSAPHLLARCATLSLLVVALSEAALADVPISNVWRKVGFGNGPGYHAKNGCRPDCKFPATAPLVLHGMAVEPCHAAPRCWATMTPSRFQAASPNQERQPTLAPQPTPATAPIVEPGTERGAGTLPASNTPNELSGPQAAPPTWSLPAAEERGELSGAASLRPVAPPGYVPPTAVEPSPEVLPQRPLGSEAPPLPASSRRAGRPALPSENAAQPLPPQVTNTPELWESGPELQLPSADGSTAAVPRRRWWAPAR